MKNWYALIIYLLSQTKFMHLFSLIIIIKCVLEEYSNFESYLSSSATMEEAQRESDTLWDRSSSSSSWVTTITLTSILSSREIIIPLLLEHISMGISRTCLWEIYKKKKWCRPSAGLETNWEGDLFQWVELEFTIQSSQSKDNGCPICLIHSQRQS